MFTATDIGGDEDLARRVIAYVRSIAPCLDSLVDDSEEKKTAIALLKGIAAEVRGRGSRLVKSQSVGPSRVEYVAVGSVVTDDDRRALRALCGVAQAGGLPLGSFPIDRPVSGLWPERY